MLSNTNPDFKEAYTGSGNVVLIAGGGKIYTDIAARFVRSERPVTEIIASPYSSELVHRILKSGHKAALEFDNFIFGIEGYSRVTEVQLVRKRMGSYLIKSGRQELNGKRVFSVVYPKNISNFATMVTLTNGESVFLSGADLAYITSQWYSKGIEAGLPEEDLRYLKPQATEFKAIVQYNAHALLDFFAVRCCQNAQHEIRDLAHKMLKICKEVAPDLFATAGPNCVQLGYCPENDLQNSKCREAGILTKSEAMQILSKAQR